MPASPALLHTPIYRAAARGILTRTSGFIAEAGFTHSLTPARNCTFGCTYCYVPTMGLYGGLKPSDWTHWGQFTTFKENAPDLLRKELRKTQVIYCSPLVDPYQPAEEEARAMPAILDAICERPPRIFVIQTRGSLILRDVVRLRTVAKRTSLRVSYSVTTDDDIIRRRYEPHCAPISERLETIVALRGAGLDVRATLAPLLPCNPERLAALAIDASQRAPIGDPLHVRETKPRGATTRAAARAIADRTGDSAWFQADHQSRIVARIREAARMRGFDFKTGPEGFSCLARDES